MDTRTCTCPTYVYEAGESQSKDSGEEPAM